MVTVAETRTKDVFTLNVTVVAPAGTVALAGTLAYSRPRSLKSAVTDLAEFMLTVQVVPETLSHPLHPPKPDRKARWPQPWP